LKDVGRFGNQDVSCPRMPRLVGQVRHSERYVQSFFYKYFVPLALLPVRFIVAGKSTIGASASWRM